MAHIIAKPCIGVKDTACITVCPVDCIHPTPAEATQFAAVQQLFIDPDVCTDCSLCSAECPVTAIYQEDDLPEQWKEFISKNAAFYVPTKRSP